MENQTGVGEGPIEPIASSKRHNFITTNPIGFEWESELTAYFNVFCWGIGVFSETILISDLYAMDFGVVARVISAQPTLVQPLQPVAVLDPPDLVQLQLVLYQ